MTPLSPASLSLSSASSLSFSCLLWVSFIPVGFFSCLSSSSKTVFSLPSFTSSSIFFFSSFSSSSLFLSPRLFLSLLFSSVSPRSLLLGAYSRFFSLLSLLLLSPYQSLPSFFSSGFFSLLVPSFSLPVSFFLYSFPLFLPRLFSASHILGFFHFILFSFSIPCLFLLSLLRVCFLLSLLLPSVFPVALLLPFSLQSSPAWHCFGYISSTLIDIHA
ncbi:hypothetical protein I3842_07G108200 [Carya illinoinensis]|uniref:Uncharacterized protein n=1 Tax=Carya illinoinensis TaxID=32201 RepID=A0A922EL64_CARIL|nr:hypothetical protein I3842_07G108200 [Carya illinoinensis]